MEAVSAVPSSVDTSIKIFDRLNAKYKEHKQLPQSVHSLQRDLRDIKKAIRTRSGTADQEGNHGWIADLKEIWRRIDDAVDLYNFKVARDNSQTGLRGVIPKVHDALAANKLLKEIKEIKRLVAAAKHRVDTFQPGNSHPGETSAAREQAYRHPKEACPEGLGTAATDLVHMLSSANPKLMIHAIVGPSGSGKSVLAEAAFNQVREQEQIKCFAWVRASHNSNIFLGSMLDELGFERPPQSKDLSQHLRGLLQGKRYIIGIDGLETTGYWNDILHACPDDNMGSRIIVTTTKEETGRSCLKNCPVPVYKMLPLDKISARDLLIRKAFGEDGWPNNLDNKCLTMILETCGYLPVAIANMGDHIRSIKEWDNDKCAAACQNIGSLLENKKKEAFIGMNHVLNRSYNNLTDNAKTLLLSLNTCGIDDIIKRKSLIRGWLAESRLHNQSEESANECFNELREQNFIQPVKFSINGQVKTFQVHHMMRHFIKDKAISENFVTYIDIHHGQKMEPRANVNRLFLRIHSTEEYSAIDKANDLSRVRWLTFQGRAGKALIMGSTGSDYLRVLFLENIENMMDDHLEAICRASMLKYLSIRGSKNVSKLPKKISKLESLETLDTRETKVEKIDMEVIIQLPELVHLFGEFKIVCKSSSIDEEFIQKIKICKLQTLSGFFIDETTPYFVKLLPCMCYLSKVRIVLQQHTTPSQEIKKVLLDSLKRCLEGVLSNLSKSEGEHSQPNLKLRSLMIDSPGGDINFMDLLEVPNPCYLQSLKLCGQLERLPNFILSDCLKELCLSHTGIGASEVLEALQTLQNLEFLKLTEDPFFEAGKTYIWRKGWFMKLKRLCFIVQRLPKIDIEEKAMESLESLQLFCTELGGFSGIKHLPRLEEVILPSDVTGWEAANLSQQISAHTMRPKFLRPSPVNADGSVRSGPILERSRRLNYHTRD